MSRSYKRVRPKKHFVYTVEDLMKLYSVVRSTVSNWVKEGLKPSDESIPFVFHGTEVKRFRDARRLTNKVHLRKGEFKCFRCKRRVFPPPGSPHLAKHCIGNLSLKICKSPEALKAWSMNMGHENEEVTVWYYKQLPDERVFEIFEQFDDGAVDTMDDKDLMLRYHEHRLDRGTPEFGRARRLVLERQANWGRSG